MFMDSGYEKVKGPVFVIQNVVKDRIVRMQWKKSFDDHLRLLVNEYGAKNWPEISHRMCKKFPGVTFTSKKCQTRWKNSINPELKKTYLSDAEELLLIICHAHYKNRWSEIISYFPHRHNNLLRNTFYSMMRKLIKRIHQDKHSNNVIDPLTFIQQLYFSGFLIELLGLTEIPKHKNPVVPRHIYSLVKDSDIDINTCKQYALKCKDRLLSSYPSRIVMKQLQSSNFEYLASEFFSGIIKIIEKSIACASKITAGFLLDVFEEVIQKDVSFASYSPLVFNISEVPNPILQLVLTGRKRAGIEGITGHMMLSLDHARIPLIL